METNARLSANVATPMHCKLAKDAAKHWHKDGQLEQNAGNVRKTTRELEESVANKLES